jgi:hypothetical protein
MGGRFFGGPTMLTTMTEEDWTIALKVFEASRPRRGDKPDIFDTDLLRALLEFAFCRRSR